MIDLPAQLGRAYPCIGKAGSLLITAALCAFPLFSNAVTETYQIDGGYDDVFCKDSGVYLNNTVTYFPWQGTDRETYLRWSIDVPAGATITSANVIVQSASTYGGTNNIMLHAVDSDDCPSFSTNPFGSAVTATGIEWTAPAFTQHVWYPSVDIKDLLQEFVDRSGYAPGNYFGLRVTKGSGWEGHRQIWTYNYSPSSGAKLEISYIHNLPPVADAGADQSLFDSDIDMGEDVTLDGSNSSDPDGTIATYEWKDSGGNLIATGATPSVFLTNGTHTITLEVTDSGGATSTDTVDITIQSPPQGTLTYSYGPTNSTYQYRSLIITAKDNSNNDLWEMQVRVPLDGNTTTGHNYYDEGEIIGFKDLAYGGTPFNYSPESNTQQSKGMIYLGYLAGQFYDGVNSSDHSWQTSQSYTFQKIHEIEPGVTGIMTMQIQAPYLVGGSTDYRTCIAAAYTVDNQTTGDVDVRFSSAQQLAGSGALSLSYGGYDSWTIANPTTSINKPNPHLTSSDGHQLYDIYDWFGSTITNQFPGYFGKFEVKDNTETQALNMRPGMRLNSWRKI